MNSKFFGASFILSLFLILVFWTYFPSLWIMVWPQLLMLAVSVLSLVICCALNFGVVIDWWKKRSTQFMLGLTITAIALIGILSTVNWLAIKYNKKKDFTASKLHSLSEQSLNIASSLKEKVNIRVWSRNVKEMSGASDVESMLENYKIASKGKINLEIKNPVNAFTEAKADGITKDNVIIIKAASGREARVENFKDTNGEEQITNALVNVIKGERKTLCFLKGHGELSLGESEALGLSQLKAMLKSSSYASVELSLVNIEAVPSNCEVLAIVGPKTDALAKEFLLIEQYLAKGGNVIALFGHNTPQSWNKVTAAHGARIRQDLIIDPRVQPAVYYVATLNYARDIPITKELNKYVLFPESSSVELSKPNAGQSQKIFVSSESHAFAVAGNIKKIKKVNLRPRKQDRTGPLAIGVVLSKDVKTPGNKDGEQESTEKNLKKSTIVLYSNHNFVSNAFLSQYGNRDLFLNTVNYLLGDQDLIGIRPRDLAKATLELSHEKIRQVEGSILILTLAFLVGALFARRRRLAAA